MALQEDAIPFGHADAVEAAVIFHKFFVLLFDVAVGFDALKKQWAPEHLGICCRERLRVHIQYVDANFPEEIVPGSGAEASQKSAERL